MQIKTSLVLIIQVLHIIQFAHITSVASSCNMEYMDVLVSLAAPFCLILTLHSWGPHWAWLWWSGGRHIWTTDPCAAEWSRCSDHILLYPYGSRQQIVNTCNRHISSHFKNLCISRTDLTTCKSNPFVILAITRNWFFFGQIWP